MAMGYQRMNAVEAGKLTNFSWKIVTPIWRSGYRVSAEPLRGSLTHECDSMRHTAKGLGNPRGTGNSSPKPYI